MFSQFYAREGKEKAMRGDDLSANGLNELRELGRIHTVFDGTKSSVRATSLGAYGD